MCGISEDQLLHTVSRVFRVSWKEQGRDVVYLTGIAAEFAEEPDQGMATFSPHKLSSCPLLPKMYHLPLAQQTPITPLNFYHKTIKIT